MCNARSILDDRFPLHQPTRLYPTGDGDYARTRALLELLYRRDFAARVEGAIALVRRVIPR